MSTSLASIWQYMKSCITTLLDWDLNFIELLDQTKDLDNQKVKTSVLQNWVMRNPQEATAWVETIEDVDKKKKYNQQVLNGWMNSNPQEAAEWYLDKAEDKQKAVDYVTQQWSWRNPTAAMEWTETQEGLDQQKSISNIIEWSIYQNPQFAISNLDKITDEKKQRKISERIYSQLKSQRKSKAEEFLASSSYKDHLTKKFSKKKENLGDFESVD